MEGPLGLCCLGGSGGPPTLLAAGHPMGQGCDDVLLGLGRVLGLQGGPRGDLTSHQLRLLALLRVSGLVLAAGTLLSADGCSGKEAVPPLCLVLAPLLHVQLGGHVQPGLCRG